MVNRNSKRPNTPAASPNSLQRADLLSVAQGLCATRNQARQLIQAGAVCDEQGQPVDKASRLLPQNTLLKLTSALPYVSRSGEKLAAALAHWQLEPAGLVALDVGISTGGFADCLRQRGARQVVGIDVGHHQLASTLADDPAIVNLEGINARDLDAVELPRAQFPLIVVDVSFISLTCVLEPVWNRLEPGGTLVCLIKPQFEVGPEIAKRTRGVIRAEEERTLARERVSGWVSERCQGSEALGWIDSPIAGGDGNREFLAAWRRGL